MEPTSCVFSLVEADAEMRRAALPWRAVHTLFSVSPWAYLSVSLPLSFCLRVCLSLTPHAFLHSRYFELFSPGQTRKQISLSVDLSSVQWGRAPVFPLEL